MSRPKTFLGQLEQAIMEAIWTSGPATVRDVLTSLQRQRVVAYTTVMTVMNRLVDQGYLRRQPNGNGAFRYAAKLSRQDVSTHATKQTVTELVRRYGDVALVQFLDRLDRVPAEKLSRLKRQVKRSHDPVRRPTII